MSSRPRLHRLRACQTHHGRPVARCTGYVRNLLPASDGRGNEPMPDLGFPSMSIWMQLALQRLVRPLDGIQVHIK